MISFYKLFLPIACFISFSTSATEISTPKTNNIIPPSFIENPDFLLAPSDFPFCDCNFLHIPSGSCREKTVNATVRFIVDTDGKAKNIKVIKSFGSPRADRSLVVDTARAKFSPALQNNNPIQYRVEQPIIFKYKPEKNPLTCTFGKSKDS